jgi:hypothetical protein
VAHNPPAKDRRIISLALSALTLCFRKRHPGEKHWQGATPTTAMTHIAIVEQVVGKAADWMEQVSDEQYQG